MINAYRILFGKPKENRPFGRNMRTLKDNIKIALKEIQCYDVDLVQMSQNRDQWWAVLTTVMNLWIP
jgi:hypothetical protein